MYRQAFRSYPFPIQKPRYLKEMMQEGVCYYCIRIEGTLAGIAAAEIDMGNENCEMTDFATLPEHRSRGFARRLLSQLENEARKRGVRGGTSFTPVFDEARIGR